MAGPGESGVVSRPGDAEPPPGILGDARRVTLAVLSQMPTCGWAYRMMPVGRRLRPRLERIRVVSTVRP